MYDEGKKGFKYLVTPPKHVAILTVFWHHGHSLTMGDGLVMWGGLCACIQLPRCYSLPQPETGGKVD